MPGDASWASMVSDHMEQRSATVDYSGYDSIEFGGGTMFYSNNITGLTTLDKYTEVVMEVNTFGKSGSYHNLSLCFRGRSGMGMADYDTFIEVTDGISNNSNIRTIITTITDTKKDRFQQLYNKYGAVYCHISSYYKSQEGEDYEKYYYAPLNIYKIYFR